MTAHSILWRRVDQPGHEAARLVVEEAVVRLTGTALFAYEGRPCRLEYIVTCDDAWRTTSALVKGWIGLDRVAAGVSVDGAGRWLLNGVEQPQVEGCFDLDLDFSPSTNLLPIRRLALPVDGEAEVRAAWLRFPGFALEPLPQVYRRTGESAYRYESAGGTFVRDLTVNGAGFVTRYPGFFETDAEA